MKDSCFIGEAQRMAVSEQYRLIRGYAAGENIPHTSVSKKSSFSFRKRLERIDWKRLGMLYFYVFFICLFVCFFVTLFVCLVFVTM